VHAKLPMNSKANSLQTYVKNGVGSAILVLLLGVHYFNMDIVNGKYGMFPS